MATATAPYSPRPSVIEQTRVAFVRIVRAAAGGVCAFCAGSAVFLALTPAPTAMAAGTATAIAVATGLIAVCLGRR